MLRAMILEHLAQAERHVGAGESTLQKQRALIARLEKNGHDTGNAQDLLRQFEALQSIHVADRDRLRAELTTMKNESVEDTVLRR